jgi:hypothetical protein
VVSFSYERHNQKALPLHPKIYRLRHDLLWKDVVYNAKKKRKFMNGIEIIEIHITSLTKYL